MKEYKRGDICPLCGEPIVTDDPEALQLLGLIAEALGLDKESEEETHGEEKSSAGVCSGDSSDLEEPAATGKYVGLQ